MIKRLFQLAVPILIYEAVTFVVGSLWMALKILKLSSMASPGTLVKDILEKAMQLYLGNILFITMLGALITIPILFFLYRRERIKHNEPTGHRQWSPEAYSYASLTGIGACILGNNLINIFRMDEISEAYQQVDQTLFSGPSIGLQLMATCLVLPVVEELIFRGLIFKNIRRDMAFVTSALVSSLLFGLYHGNLVQLVYAFMMGLLLCYSMECYQTLAAPVILHCTANLCSVAMSHLVYMKAFESNLVFAVFTTVLALAAVVMGCIGMKKEVVSMTEKRRID